ncbi:MAG: LptF/LptG family permease [Simkaniaceae bacterium]|nr:LptF/LptG family permease [Simkaniaceae bacterium]
MPVLWRYLICSYLSLFFLCVAGFITTLLLLCLQEMTHLAGSGSTVTDLFLFVLCQISYLLPITFPLAALIAAFLVMYRLSETRELIALRSAGVTMRTIRCPLLLVASLLTLINYVTTNEVTPRARRCMETLGYDAVTSNPLLLLTKAKKPKPKKIYASTTLFPEKTATDTVIALSESATGRLALITADTLHVRDRELTGKGVACISYTKKEGEPEGGFDHLLIENQESMSTSVDAFIAGICPKRRIVPHEHMATHQPFAPLIRTAFRKGGDIAMTRRTRFECFRRLFFACITYVSTYAGAVYGVQTGHVRGTQGLLSTILFTIITLSSSVMAKSLHATPYRALICYLFPFGFLLFSLFYKNLKRS